MKSFEIKGISLLLLLTSIVGMISCQPTMNVQSSFNRSADFKQYKTFAWYPAEAANNLRTGYDPEVDRRVKTAVEAAFVKKGILPDAANPDILIAFDVALEEKQAENADLAPGFGYGYSYWYGYRFKYDVNGVPNSKSITQYPTGTLIIDLVNPKTNELVWRGVAEGEIEADQTDERDIRGSVSKILSQYPPK
ncbi:DUF4136 domain-containing protein [Pontibacter vulgaris]|uniref:DUF4136 domain-containing protein n=1 Tax=Pontibacter vulgaris TaxID=2905679 RepID=UPI001FA709B7|nr:DUF4136 domain-containing protein [Pontibacter vulgaris]